MSCKFKVPSSEWGDNEFVYPSNIYRSEKLNEKYTSNRARKGSNLKENEKKVSTYYKGEKNERN